MARDEPVVVVGQPIASQADMALFTAFSKSRSTMCTACRTSQPRRFTLHVPLNMSETVEAKTIAAPATRAQCGPKSIELSRLPAGAVAGRPASAWSAAVRSALPGTRALAAELRPRLERDVRRLKDQVR